MTIRPLVAWRQGLVEYPPGHHSYIYTMILLVSSRLVSTTSLQTLPLYSYLSSPNGNSPISPSSPSLLLLFPLSQAPHFPSPHSSKKHLLNLQKYRRLIEFWPWISLVLLLLSKKFWNRDAFGGRRDRAPAFRYQSRCYSCRFCFRSLY